MDSVFLRKYNFCMTNAKPIVMGQEILWLAELSGLGWYIGFELE